MRLISSPANTPIKTFWVNSKFRWNSPESSCGNKWYQSNSTKIKACTSRRWAYRFSLTKRSSVFPTISRLMKVIFKLLTKDPTPLSTNFGHQINFKILAVPNSSQKSQSTKLLRQIKIRQNLNMKDDDQSKATTLMHLTFQIISKPLWTRWFRGLKMSKRRLSTEVKSKLPKMDQAVTLYDRSNCNCRRISLTWAQVFLSNRKTPEMPHSIQSQDKIPFQVLPLLLHSANPCCLNKRHLSRR